MRIASIVGARPQFIKCAALSKELSKTHQGIIIHTGQHYDYKMSQLFFEELGIPIPDFNLGIGSGDAGYQIGEAIKLLEPVLKQVKPDLVMVYGDTNSTLAGAITANKLGIKIGHVEAGMRSYDRTMPEEINRILTDHCSDMLFCPTNMSVSNLHREGVWNGTYLTGDVMVDVLETSRNAVAKSGVLASLDIRSKDYLLATIHRPSNTDSPDNLRNVVDALCDIKESVVFPLHPRTHKYLDEYGFYERLSKCVRLIEPLGYVDFIRLLSEAKKVLTDSGGVQKEAYILGVPCITLRKNTEWNETVADGWNILVGADGDAIVKAAREFNPRDRRWNINVFSLGASKRIVELLACTF